MATALNWAGSLFGYLPIRIFFWVIAVLFAFGGAVHVANMLSLSGFDWRTAPLLWRVLDVVFLALNATVVIGALFRSGWAVLAFLVAAALQIVLYGFLPEHFAAAGSPQARAIQGLLYLNLFLLIIFASLAGIRALSSTP